MEHCFLLIFPVGKGFKTEWLQYLPRRETLLDGTKQALWVKIGADCNRYDPYVAGWSSGQVDNNIPTEHTTSSFNPEDQHRHLRRSENLTPHKCLMYLSLLQLQKLGLHLLSGSSREGDHEFYVKICKDVAYVEVPSQHSLGRKVS